MAPTRLLCFLFARSDLQNVVVLLSILPNKTRKPSKPSKLDAMEARAARSHHVAEDVGEAAHTIVEDAEQS